MPELTVDLGDRSYPILIGSHFKRAAEAIRAVLRGRQVCIVSNTTIAPLYLDTLLESLSDGTPELVPELKISTVILPDGEQYKDLSHLNLIFDRLLEDGHNRHTCLVALGGGVVGDMTGYAAASYQRGVDFVQLPTTLLSQVDSSVGGKTGVNHRLGKNMIGAFHQPRLVIADTDVLKSLPDREYAAGLAEVIKYGLIADFDFLQWLEQHRDALIARDSGALAQAVERSCACKAQVVAEDEREGGRRAILNLGHTFGHAIEAELGYGQWLHGEAVAAGMVMACQLSADKGWLTQADVERVRDWLRACDLPVNTPGSMTSEQFLAHMARDKKVLDGGLRLVLLRQLGEAIVTDEVNAAEVAAVIEACR